MTSTRIAKAVATNVARNLFVNVEADAIEAGSMFCLRAMDEKVFDRALFAVTGCRPSVAAARMVKKAIDEKVSAGYDLSGETAELLRLANRALTVH